MDAQIHQVGDAVEYVEKLRAGRRATVRSSRVGRVEGPDVKLVDEEIPKGGRR